MTTPLPGPDAIKAAMASPRWSALVRADATVQDIGCGTRPCCARRGSWSRLT